MKQALERIIEKYGTQILWQQGGKQRQIRGFFQPVTSRSWQKLKREMFPLGHIPTEMYEYIGPESCAVQEGDFLTVGDREYVFHRTEVLYDRNGPLYRWGLCVRKGRNEV